MKKSVKCSATAVAIVAALAGVPVVANTAFGPVSYAA